MRNHHGVSDIKNVMTGYVVVQAESIDKEVTTGERKLGKLLSDAKQTLTALKVELCDEELERACPIVVGAEIGNDDVMLAAGAEE